MVLTELRDCVCKHLTRTGWWHSADWFNTMTGAASGCQIWFKVTCMQRQKNHRSMDRRAKVSFQSTKSCMFLFVTFRRHAHSVWLLSFFRVLLKRSRENCFVVLHHPTEFSLWYCAYHIIHLCNFYHFINPLHTIWKTIERKKFFFECENMPKSYD